MGADIHPAVEVRRKGTWRYHRPNTPCRWYNETWSAAEVVRVNERLVQSGFPPVKAGDRRNPWDRCKTRLPECFTDRNYAKFAILGNVRNGYGFAGIVTGDPLTPISDGRGYPPDVTKEAMAKMSKEHSATWVTLSEILDYNILLPMTHRGVITEQQFLDCLINDKTPDHWGGSITGPNIMVLSPTDYLALFGKTSMFGTDPASRTYDSSVRYHIAYEWHTQIKDAVPDLEEMTDYLVKIVPKGGTTDDVRIVMDFDS